MSAPRETTLPIAQIRTDLGTQSRAGVDEATVEEYAEAMRRGSVFPPVVVFFDGGLYILADGAHRVPAALRAGRQEIRARIYEGNRWDAILYSVGANDEHGRRRSAADKKQAVMMILLEKHWADRPQSWVAEVCKVSQSYVSQVAANLRESGLLPSYKSSEKMEQEPVAPGRKLVTRGGKTYEMDTSRIGKGSKRKLEAEPGRKGASRAAEAEDDVADLAEAEPVHDEALVSDLEELGDGIRGLARRRPFARRDIIQWLRRLVDELERS